MGSTVSGVLKANESAKYDVTVTRPSKLIVDVSGFGENTRVTLQDERGKQVLYQSLTSDGVRPAQAFCLNTWSQATTV